MVAVNYNTCNSKERLADLKKSIFKEEFEREQKNISNLISGELNSD